MRFTRKELIRRIRASFELKTSSRSEEWTPENPAFGQCAVAALVLQDYFGGNIEEGPIHFEWYTTARFCSHVWNRINGRRLDITRDQFPEQFPYRKMVGGGFGQVIVLNRKKMLANERLAEKYARLALKVQELAARNA